MATTCLNCGASVTERYCPHCGQKATVERLSWQSLLHELLHFFTHIEHGFIKTTKQLIIHPGFVIKSYLEGKRKEYHKPIGFLMIWIAIYLLFAGLVNKFGNYSKEELGSFFNIGVEVSAMIDKYRSIIEILCLPFTCLIGWLIIARPKLNYVEVMVTNFYFISVLFIVLAMRNFAGLVFQFNPNTDLLINLSILGFIIWMLYGVYDLYSRLQVKWLLLRIAIFSVIVVFVYVFLQIGIAKLFIAWGF